MKKAFCTVLNDPFVDGFIVTMKSMLEYNPDFNFPYFIIYSEKVCRLSNENMEKLKTIYPNFVFHKTDETRYSHIFSLRDQFLNTPERLHAAFLIIEAFSLWDYDQVICLDSDLLCLGRINELTEINCDFAAVRAHDKTGFPQSFFNSGVFIIGKKYLSRKTYMDLLTIDGQMNYNQRYGKADQALLNIYFKNKTYHYLDRIYNTTKRAFTGLDEVSLLEAIKGHNIIFYHYVATKPWQDGCETDEPEYGASYKLWKVYARRYGLNY